jgi:dihydroflavonol-4-reductase
LRVFITGGNGFIGSVVVRQLVTAGHDVVCLVRETSNTARIDGARFERALGDVRDVTSLRAAMPTCDCTIHLAAPGGWNKDDASLLHSVIEGGARNVLDVAATLPGHRVVMTSSTAAVNGSDTPQVFDERAEFTLTDPSLYYSHAKHRAELAARSAADRGVPVIVVNPAEVYGPNDLELATAGNLVDLAKSWPVLVCDGGTGVVHVDDVATGIIAALERGRPGERYILAGENVTVRRLAELVLELLGRRAPIVELPNELARFISRVAIALRLPLPYSPYVIPYATRYWFVDNTKARRELGLTFRGARDTIRSALDWLEQTGRVSRPRAAR